MLKPIKFTGTAVGIISVVGYTPDIFATPIIGYLLDNYPGSLGHQYVFTMLLLFSLLGLWASLNFNRNLNTRWPPFHRGDILQVIDIFYIVIY